MHGMRTIFWASWTRGTRGTRGARSLDVWPGMPAFPVTPGIPGNTGPPKKPAPPGAELAVLRGAVVALAECVVVEVEVEFAQLYVGQPLFADVDAFLRSQGFGFHRFTGIQGRTLKPFIQPQNPYSYTQQLWADAVYRPSRKTIPISRSREGLGRVFMATERVPGHAAMFINRVTLLAGAQVLHTASLLAGEVCSHHPQSSRAIILPTPPAPLRGWGGGRTAAQA
eukprot:gene19425-biopygen2154